jgi:hypothetical protein
VRLKSLKELSQAPPAPRAKNGRRRVTFDVPETPTSESVALLHRLIWRLPIPLGNGAPAGPGTNGPLQPIQLWPHPAPQPHISQSIETDFIIERKTTKLPTHKPASNGSVEHLPRTAAYYNSSTSKSIDAAGKDQVPCRTIKQPKGSCAACAEHNLALPDGKESILTFSRSSVNRAKVRTGNSGIV